MPLVPSGRSGRKCDAHAMFVLPFKHESRAKNVESEQSSMVLREYGLIRVLKFGGTRKTVPCQAACHWFEVNGEN